MGSNKSVFDEIWDEIEKEVRQELEADFKNIGRAQARAEIALNLIRLRNLSYETIAKVCKISVNLVRELATLFAQEIKESEVKTKMR
ncbi:MAG: hypothetical protein IJT21_03795 [Synergistaceae bacterium]|nr:hypothetical protein [Synergistaceae bacterium]